MSDSKKIFKFIVESEHPKRLAVFDLDSTLFGVSGRSQAILRELAENPEFLERFGQHQDTIAKIEVLKTDWGIREALKRSGLFEVPELPKFAKNHWDQSFFSNNYLHHDEVYPGALEFVEGLQSAGVEIMYLTGRDAPNMKEGTLRILEQSGFPVSQPETRLHMKPLKGSRSDEEFKSKKFNDILEGDENTWFFENEPIILHRVRGDHPHINLIYIDSVHSGRAEAPTDLPTIGGEVFFKT